MVQGYGQCESASAMKPPLGSIRLLDLSQALSGPASSRMMADLGAEVIKIEPPKVGEAARNMGASFIGGESMYYMIYNRSKKGMTIDLRQDEGRQVFYDLVQHLRCGAGQLSPGRNGPAGRRLRHPEED